MALFRSRKIRMAAKNVSHQERIGVSPAERACSSDELGRRRRAACRLPPSRDGRTTFPSLLLSHSGTGSRAATLILIKTDTASN